MGENPEAFPCAGFGLAGERHLQEGMSLRDWFAGQALTAIIGSSPSEAVQDVCSGVRGGRPMAYGAYAIADAMLAARSAAQ